MPFQKPSTTTRARNSRFSMLIKAFGLMSEAEGREGLAALSIRTLVDRLTFERATRSSFDWGLYGFNQAFNHGLDGHALSLRAVINLNAMPQNRIRQRLNILDGHMRAAFQQRARLGAERQELACPRARPPTRPFIDKIRRSNLLGPR